MGRLLAVIDSKPSKRRTRRLERLELETLRRVTDKELGKQIGVVDWSAADIDWPAILDLLASILKWLIPLLLGLL